MRQAGGGCALASPYAAPTGCQGSSGLLRLALEGLPSAPNTRCPCPTPRQVMEENNLRVLAPWRQYYPLMAMRYNSKVNQVGQPAE